MLMASGAPLCLNQAHVFCTGDNMQANRDLRDLLEEPWLCKM